MALLWNAYAGASLPQRLLATLRAVVCPPQALQAAIPHGSCVLDIGCGNGLWLVMLAQARGIRGGIGVERNVQALATARQAASSAGLPLRFKTTANPCEWPDTACEVVSMIDVLHHVPRQARATFVRAACARVAPGGRFVYKDMALRPWWAPVWNQLHDLVLARQRVHVEPISRVARWAHDSGLQLRHERRFTGAWLYRHELAVFVRPRR